MSAIDVEVGSPTDEVAGLATFRQWAVDNWDPTSSVGEWWSRLALAGYSSAILPVDVGGRAWSRRASQGINEVLAELGMLGPPIGVGLTLVAPTLAQFGSPEQRAELIPPILDGRHYWAQLYSEPGAGSDLASLTTSAEWDGSDWRVSGSKIWTSGAHLADLGFLLARTETGGSKQAGISAFVVDMAAPGIRIEPLRLMTGRGGFSAVHLDDVRIPPGNLIGARGQGWTITKSMLEEERSSYRAAGSGDLAAASPGTRAGQLGTSVEEALNQEGRAPLNIIGETEVWRLRDIALSQNRLGDPMLRSELLQLWRLVELSRLVEARGPFDGAANISKLLISDTWRQLQRTDALAVGPALMVTGEQAVTGGWLQEMSLFSPGPAIYGGTDQIQKNVIAERVLGLPR